MSKKKLHVIKKALPLHPHSKECISVDLLAQQVEHIPFKDGVLGSSPRQITKKMLLNSKEKLSKSGI